MLLHKKYEAWWFKNRISLELQSQQSVREFAGVRQGHTPWPSRARRESDSAKSRLSTGCCILWIGRMDGK